MAEQTLFTKIINHEIPADIRYQDDDVTVFADIRPRAKVHLLVVPTKAIASINDLTDDDALLVGKLVLTAKKMAEDLGIAADGYRLIFNVGSNGGQAVPHIHLHLLGGEPLGFGGFVTKADSK